MLLIFKYYVYKNRESGSLDVKVLKRNIHKTKNLKNKQASTNQKNENILNKNGNHC